MRQQCRSPAAIIACHHTLLLNYFDWYLKFEYLWSSMHCFDVCIQYLMFQSEYIWLALQIFIISLMKTFNLLFLDLLKHKWIIDTLSYPPCNKTSELIYLICHNLLAIGWNFLTPSSLLSPTLSNYHCKFSWGSFLFPFDSEMKQYLSFLCVAYLAP